MHTHAMEIIVPCSLPLLLLVAVATGGRPETLSVGSDTQFRDSTLVNSGPVTVWCSGGGDGGVEGCTVSYGQSDDLSIENGSHKAERAKKKTKLYHVDKYKESGEGKEENGKQRRSFGVTRVKPNRTLRNPDRVREEKREYSIDRVRKEEERENSRVRVREEGGREYSRDTTDEAGGKRGRRRRDTTDDHVTEEGEGNEGEEGEELPTPEELAWVDPDQLVRQGAWVEKVPSLANLVGLQVFKYGFPNQSPPSSPHRRQPPRAPNPRPRLSPDIRRNNKPHTIPNTAGRFFGNEFHDKFDKYYKSLRQSRVEEVGRMGSLGRHQHSSPRLPHPRQGGTNDNFLQLLNPFNLFGHNQFPQLPRYPYPILPPGQRALPSQPGDNVAVADLQQKDIRYEVVTDLNAEVHKGYHYKEDYPMRDDLYIGQDGNVYFKKDYLKPSSPIQDQGPTRDPPQDSPHESLHTPDPTPSNSPPLGRFNDDYKLSPDHNDFLHDSFFEDEDYDDGDDGVSSYTHLLGNHNVGNQFSNSLNDHRNVRQPIHYDPRPRPSPRYPPGPVRNPSYGRSPPSPPRSPYTSILEWLFPSFARGYPSYFYNPREVMLPRFRYLAAPWSRPVNPAENEAHLSPHDGTQPRQSPPSGPLRPVPPHPSPSRPFLSGPPSPRIPFTNPSPNRPFLTNSPLSRPFNNRPFPPNLAPSRPSPAFNRPPSSSFSPSRPELSKSLPPRLPLESTAPRSPPQQFLPNPHLRHSPNSPPRPAPPRHIPNSPLRQGPNNLPRRTPNTPPRNRQSDGRIRAPGGDGFYPGNGFFNADFPTAYHMAHTQGKKEGEDGKAPLPSSQPQSSATTPVDQMQASSSSSSLPNDSVSV